MLQAMNRQPIPAGVLRAHFSPVLLAQASPAQISQKFALYGRLRLVSLTSSRPKSVVFVMSVRGAQRFQIRLSVDTHGLIAGLQTLREIPPTASPASVLPRLAPGWVAQPVTFQAGGVTVHGTYTHPRRAATRTVPAAVLLAGSGTATDRNGNGTTTGPNGHNVWQSHRNTLEAVANWLSADGVASLRYDKLGSGQTGWGRYAGHPGRIGLTTYEQEAAAALRFLARQSQINPSRLAAVGHSEGTLYALLLGSGLVAHAPRLHAVVLLEPVPARMLSLMLPAPGTVPPAVRRWAERAVASLRQTGRLPQGLPPAITKSFNPDNWGTQSELSQIDRYDPASVAAELPPRTPVLLTCSNADQYFTCAMENRIATAVSKAHAKLDYVHLTGVDHLLKEDVALDPAVWNQALPFSNQLRTALRAFVTNSL